MVSQFDAPAIRRYLDELGYPVDPNRLVDHPNQLPSTLCYLVDSGRLLMLRRRKEPFAGHWTAPGGKIKPGETPLEAVFREMHEETGLTVVEPQLKVVCSESGDTDYNWLLFIFEPTVSPETCANPTRVCSNGSPSSSSRRGACPTSTGTSSRTCSTIRLILTLSASSTTTSTTLQSLTHAPSQSIADESSLPLSPVAPT